MKSLLPVALIFAVATIPLAHNLNSIAIILLIVVCVFQQPLRITWQELKRSRYWILPVVYFLWIACSYFWDSSGGYSSKNIERYAILFFMPPALAAMPRISYGHIRAACFAFIGITVVVCIICLVKSFLEYRISGDYRVFYYHYLSQQLSLNAIFLSNYCLASFVWLFYFGRGKIHRILMILLAAFLVGMVMLLSSKMVLLLLVLFFPAYILYRRKLRLNLLRVFLVLLLLLGGGYLALQQLPYLKWRITSTEIKTYSGPEDNNNGVAIRLYMWKTGFEMFKERPLLGYGLKGAREETLKRYREDGFELGYANNYHTHNQYLESSIMAGLPALLLLLMIIVGALRQGFKKTNLLLLAGTLHFAIHSIIESTFEVQQEQVFFMLFIFLFYYHTPKKNDTGYAENSLF